MFPGLPPAQEQGKHMLLSLVVKMVLDIAHCCLEKGKWLSKTKKGAETFWPANLMGSLCAGSRPGDELWLGAPAPC